VRALLLSLVLVVGVAAVPPARAAGSCRNLRIPAALRASLVKAHDRPVDGAIEKGSVYYGVCGSTRYAVAVFSKALADQPEKFRKRPGQAWRDEGDGFENGCDAGARSPIPKALVSLWHICTP
jgi:hypothetical protein